MARKKTVPAPAESAQEVRDGLGVGMDTPGTKEAAEGQVIGPADESELAGCQDETELQEGELMEHTVTAQGGLNLRERPSLEAPVLAVLPWGAGVFADEPQIGEWLPVTTGLLSGYMLARHLAPLASQLKAVIEYD